MSEQPTATIRIEGHCDPRFEPVREALRANFAERGELGAAVAVRVGGRLVVDLYGGTANPDTAQYWQRDTLVNAYSVGKAVLATLALILVEQGRVDLDAPVERVWPEFGVEGKGGISLRTLLAHRAGLPAVRERLPEGAMYDWPRMCAALASQRPYWKPDTDHGYHVNSFGFLVGEVLQRATGRPLSSLLREHIAGPLDVDFHFGLPPALHARVPHMCAPDVHLDSPEQWAAGFPPSGDAEHDQMIWHTYFNPPGISGMGRVNTAAWRESVIPSTSGHGDARAVAAIYAALLEGGVGTARWLGESLLAEATSIHSDGRDPVIARPSPSAPGLQPTHP